LNRKCVIGTKRMTDARQIRVVIDLPPDELKPNARPHHFAKAKAKKWYRSMSNIAARELLNATMPWKEAEIRVAYHHKTRRFCDPDNILASLKSAFDGLVDAGVLADDRDVTYPPVVREHDKENPRVELTVICLDGDDA